MLPSDGTAPPAWRSGPSTRGTASPTARLQTAPLVWTRMSCCLQEEPAPGSTLDLMPVHQPLPCQITHMLPGNALPLVLLLLLLQNQLNEELLQLLVAVINAKLFKTAKMSGKKKKKVSFLTWERRRRSTVLQQRVTCYCQISQSRRYPGRQ